MPNNEKIIWVVNCVNRKALKTDKDMSISTYSSNPNLRLTEWVNRLSKPLSPLVEAIDLYQGENWNVVKTTLSELNQTEVELWIVSTGYGLIPSHAQIESYDATFDKRSDNYVAKNNNSNHLSSINAQLWWSKLNEWEGPLKKSSRSFFSLLNNNPDIPIVISLSQSYFSVVSDDIQQAILNSPINNNLFLVSSGELPEALKHFHIPTHSRYTKKLGGTRIAINFRTAAEILNSHSTHCFNFETVRAMVASNLESIAEPTSFKRKKMTDYEVLSIIESLKKASPCHSHSSLLRVYRDQGYACEQSRFRDLYNKSQKSF